MELRVGDIPADGVFIESGPDKPWMEQAVRDAVEQELASWTASIAIAAPDRRRIDIVVDLSLTVTQDCDRCGEPIQSTIEDRVELRYLPDDAIPEVPRADEEIELGEDELDLGWYRDGNLSVADVVSEAIALAMPMRFTCQDTTGCDARTAALLDAAKDRAGGHPGFAALKNWN